MQNELRNGVDLWRARWIRFTRGEASERHLRRTELRARYTLFIFLRFRRPMYCLIVARSTGIVKRRPNFRHILDFILFILPVSAISRGIDVTKCSMEDA